MPDISEKEKDFLVKRAAEAVGKIMLEGREVSGIATRAYQVGYAHANEDRQRITEKVNNNG